MTAIFIFGAFILILSFGLMFASSVFRYARFATSLLPDLIDPSLRQTLVPRVALPRNAVCSGYRFEPSDVGFGYTQIHLCIVSFLTVPSFIRNRLSSPVWQA
jgi:hypothetical protein